MELNQHTYQRFCRLIYQRLGIAFDENKIYFLQKRLERRVKELSLSSMEEYHFLVAYADPEGKELRSLASLVTTNETYMFREYEQLEAFANFCLPEIVEKKTVSGEKTLRIWSAGCSSGEEPYTLAIIIREIFPQSVTWNIQIMATDIDETVLARARAGVYGDRSMRHVPADYRDRHFLARGSYHQIRLETAELVSFSYLNLHERAAMRAMRHFDFVFCRNVLIYFDDLSRQSTVDHFFHALNPGGFLFLGHSESVGRISNSFRLRRMDRHLMYMRP